MSGVFELGGGAQYLASNRDGFMTPFFRIGGHLPLDQNERWAIPFGFDLGKTVRFRWGVRARLTEQLFIELFPFNPLFTGSGLGDADRRGWTWPTTFEVGFAL